MATPPQASSSAPMACTPGRAPISPRANPLGGEAGRRGVISARAAASGVISSAGAVAWGFGPGGLEAEAAPDCDHGDRRQLGDGCAEKQLVGAGGGMDRAVGAGQAP